MTAATRAYTATIGIDGAGMAIHAARPAATERSPGIVVIMHAPGVDTFMHSIAERLARAGFAAVAPDLYHRQREPGSPLERMRRLIDAQVIADVAAAVGYLREQRDVDAERIGVMGFCMGGRVAYLTAATNRHIKAAVVYCGGNIVLPWGPGPSPFARSADIACPILFHFGEEDDNPSPADRVKLDAELTRLGKEHEFHTYPNAAHAFMNFSNAERYRETAAEASWPRTLAFLERRLRG